MKENKNNELKKDALEQVAGGGGPKFYSDALAAISRDLMASSADMLAMTEQLEEMLKLASVTPSGPDRQAIWKASMNLMKQLKGVQNVAEQQLQARDEIIDQITKFL